MHPLLVLFAAIVCEITATTSIKLSDGFRKPLPSVLVVVGYALAFWLFSIASRRIGLGVAYAIWAGLGVAGAMIIGMMFFKEPLLLARIAGVLLIISGVIVLSLFGDPLAH